MKITIDELREKAVVNTDDGTCFGCADDVMIDTEAKIVEAIIIKGRLRLFGLLGREEDYLIPWEDVICVGRDTVLVNYKAKPSFKTEEKGFWQKFLNNF